MMSCVMLRPAGSDQQRVRFVWSQHALEEQRSPDRAPAGRRPRVPGQTEAGGSTALPDQSDTCRRHHPGETAAVTAPEHQAALNHLHIYKEFGIMCEISACIIF